MGLLEEREIGNGRQRDRPKCAEAAAIRGAAGPPTASL